MKQLIVGDIHGCLHEFQALLDRAGLSSGDRVIALGDIIDRGPDSPDVLDYFLRQNGLNQPDRITLMGNHERKHVRAFNGHVRPALSQKITRRQLGEDGYPEICGLLDQFPRFLELPEAVLVHAFFEPSVPLSEQKEVVIVGTLQGEAYLKETYDRPWFEIYDGDKPLVVGHHDYLQTGAPFVYRDRVFGVDTGCCFGRALTGLVLPDFRLISVPARQNYWTQMKDRYADLRFEMKALRNRSLTWEQIEALRAAAEAQPSLSQDMREHLLRLDARMGEAERVLKSLFAQILEQNGRTLAALGAECDFDTLSDKEQGRLYAGKIGQSQLSGFLHQARKEMLTLESLRQRFKRPEDVIRFAERIGL